MKKCFNFKKMSTKYHTNFSGGNFWEGGGQFFLGAPLLGGGNSASSRGNLGTKSFNWNALYKLQ